MNPLFNMLINQNQPKPMESNVIQRFQQFQRMFSGDPKQQIQQLLSSGRVSQQQYNQAVQMANQLQRLINNH
jgi:vancomycin permeability regulator SanA